jgi:hypothetical protein
MARFSREMVADLQGVEKISVEDAPAQLVDVAGTRQISSQSARDPFMFV